MAFEPWDHCMLGQSAMLSLGEDNQLKTMGQVIVTYYGENVFTDKLKEGADTWEQAIAQLGRGGWQMVNASHTDSDYGVNGHFITTTLYFKRPAATNVRQPLLGHTLMAM